jgi:tellurite resistance protein TehA-like permease
MKFSSKSLLILCLVFLGLASFSIGFGLAYTWVNDKPFDLFYGLFMLFVALMFVFLLLFMKKKKEEKEEEEKNNTNP